MNIINQDLLLSLLSYYAFSSPQACCLANLNCSLPNMAKKHHVILEPPLDWYTYERRCKEALADPLIVEGGADWEAIDQLSNIVICQ